MASTFSSSLRLELMGTGENNNLWGNIANTQFELLETAIAGITSVTCDGNSSITLTTNNGSTDQARAAVLVFKGTPTSAISVKVPNTTKQYLVRSKTSGSFAVKIKHVANGGSVSFDTGDTKLVYGDGNKFHTIATATQATGIPSGVIVLWSGTITTIPSGWFLCDGNNGTPNLTDRFVLGTTVSNATDFVGETGGSFNLTGTTGAGGDHNHGGLTAGVSAASATGWGQDGGDEQNYSNINNKGRHQHGISSSGTHTHSINITNAVIPPYYRLAYIMKA